MTGGIIYMKKRDPTKKVTVYAHGCGRERREKGRRERCDAKRKKVH